MSCALGKRLTLLSGAALLAACAASPPLPTLDPARSAQEFQGRRLDASALGRPEQEPWSLAALELAALSLNPRIGAAMAQLEAAHAQSRFATQRANPELQLSLEHAFGGGAEAWLYGAALELLQLRSGERERAMQLAALEELLAHADLDQTRAGVRTDLRRAFVETQQATRESRTRQRLVEARAALLDSIRIRTQAGDLASWEQLRAQVELADAKAKLREVQAQAADARVRLAAAIGIPTPALDAVELQEGGFEEPARSTPASGEMRMLALVRHVEVQRALHEYAKADLELQSEVARRSPATRLAPGYAWDQGERKLTLGVAFELPIFNRNEGPIAAALARRTAAASRLFNAQVQVYERIERAEHALQAAQADIADTRASIRLAREAYESELRRLSAGASDRQSVLAAELNLLEAESQDQRAQSAALLAAGALDDALQLPASEEAWGPVFASTEP